jgi:hypothetical protein
MASLQVADGGNGLHIWRVAANMLNKQSWTPDKGLSSNWGLGMGLKSPHCKRSFLQNITRSLGHGWILWINDLSERNWI